MLGWILLVSIVILILLSLFFLFDDLLLDRREKKEFQRKVYKELHYFVEEQDQLLLNHVNLYLSPDSADLSLFDHILLADKYVYVIHDFYAHGGIYGNVKDAMLFLKGYDEEIKNIPNPILQNEEEVKKLEEFLSIQHSDKILVSVVTYNSSLIVPDGIGKKEQNSWFLPLSDLVKTIRQAEQDDVTPISHEKTEKIVKALQERSNLIKREIKQQSKKK
jgi:hypothetical protein